MTETEYKNDQPNTNDETSPCTIVKEELITEETKLPTFKYDNEKAIDENASDLIELSASQEALNDSRFIQDIAETKKEQIKESAKINKEIHSTKKMAEKINALTERDKAFYEQWKAILNFGGVREPTTKIFSIFMLFIILPFYVLSTLIITIPISIVNVLFSKINELFTKISEFGKIGRSLAITVLILCGVALIAYIVYCYLHKYGIAGL